MALVSLEAVLSEAGRGGGPDYLPALSRPRSLTARAVMVLMTVLKERHPDLSFPISSDVQILRSKRIY